MKSTLFGVAGVVVGTVLGTASLANAQNAQGRAFGTTLTLGGSSVIDQSDTGVQTAPNGSVNPDCINGSAAGATVPAPPLIDVITGPSRTRGSINPGDCNVLFSPPGADPLDPTLKGKFFVHSKAGNSTTAFLVGQAPGPADVLDAVSSGSTAHVDCDPNTGVRHVVGDSQVDALVIGGTPVPIPGPVAPNTTIVTSPTQLIVLNEQSPGCATTSTLTCTVTALHAIGVQNGEVFDLNLSSSTATLSNLPPPCNTGPIACSPQLAGIKNSVILEQDRTTPKSPQAPAAGDPIRFTISVTNNAAAPDPSCPADSTTAPEVTVIDRIPQGVTVDPSSIQVQTDNDPPVSATGTIANCDANLSFAGCTPEAASDSTRQCLTVSAGSLSRTHTKNVSFVATVDSTSPVCTVSGSQRICNTVLIQGSNTPISTPATSIILCPPAPDRLITTGGGGCSLGTEPNAKGSETWPVVLMGIFLALRQWRRRASRV